MVEALALLFVIMQALDGLSTYIIIKDGGRELNPAMQIAMNFLGVLPALIVVKFLVIAVFLAFIDDIPAWAWLLMNGIYAYVLYNNFTVLRDMKKLR
jgi:hypothetical protein